MPRITPGSVAGEWNVGVCESVGDDSVAVRGIGPSLTGVGVTNALPDPNLELRDSNGALVMSNNDWQDDATQAAQLTAANLALSNDLESGIISNLSPGPYTAVLGGRNNGVGVGLVEIYDLGQAVGSSNRKILPR